jgi:DNA polymerase III delta prime subunit
MLVEYSIMQFVLMVRRDMVENRIEADRKKVLGVIRKKKNITHSQLLRKIRHISARDMRDIISILCEANQIVEDFAQIDRRDGLGKSKPAKVYRYIQG